MARARTGAETRIIAGAVIGLVLGAAAGDPLAGLVGGAALGWMTTFGSTSSRAHLEFTARWVNRVWSEGVIDDRARHALLTRLREEGVLVSPAQIDARAGTEAAVHPARAAAEIAAPAAEVAAGAPATAGLPAEPVMAGPPPSPTAEPIADAPTQPPVRPRIDRFAPLRAAWARLRSDVAVHGLTYLGVLLVFVAVLGFVMFAFTSVGTVWRPLAEVSVPAVTFGAAAFLRSRRAPYVATAMEILGGALTPVVLFAAFADGAALPPDLDRAPLLVALTLVSLLLAAVYATVVHRRPTSALRFLIVPLVWVAVGVIGLAFAEGPSAAQMAVVSGAVALTPYFTRRLPWRHEAAVVWPPALGVGYLLVLLFAYADSWPLWPVAVGGIAVLLGVERFGPARPYRWAAATAVVLITGATALASYDPGWVGLALVLAFMALFEVGRRAPDQPEAASPVFLAGIGVGIFLALSGGWSLVSAGAAVTAWSHLSRRRNEGFPVATVLTAIAALAPVLPAVGLGRVFGEVPVLAVSGLVLVGVSMVVRTAPASIFYRWFVAAWAPVIAVWTAFVLADPFGRSDLFLLAAAAGAAVVALAMTSVTLRYRVWVGGPMTVWAGHLLAEALVMHSAGRAVALAAAGLMVVTAAWLVRSRYGGDVALAGHLAGVGALAIPADGWWSFGVILAATAGWMIEVALAETGRSILTSEDWAVDPAVVSPAGGTVTALGLAWATAAAGQALGFAFDGILAAWVAAGAGLAYAAIGRMLHGRDALGRVVTGAAGAFSVGSVLIAAGAMIPDRHLIGVLAFGVAASVAADPGHAGRARWWYGWALSTPLIGVSAVEMGATPTALAWVLLSWGALCVVVGVAVDRILSGSASGGWLLRVPWLVPPVVFGIGAGALGLALGHLRPYDETWPFTVAVTLVGLAVAGISRNGWISAVSAVGAASAVWSSLTGTPFDPLDRPWVLVVLAALFTLVRGVIVLSPLPLEEKDPWSLPAFVAAHGLTLTALGLAVGSAELAITFAAAAAVAFLAAVTERGAGWAAAGEVLLVVAAWDAGPVWLAFVLVVSSAAFAVLALLVRAASSVFEWLAAGFALFGTFQVLVALEASQEATAIVVVLLAALAAAGWAVAARLRGFGPIHLTEWALPWLAAAAVATAGSMLWELEAMDRVVAGVITGGLLVWAASIGAMATPARLPVARMASALIAAAAIGYLGLALDVSETGWVTLGVGFGVAATVAGLWLWSVGDVAWRRAATVFGSAVQVGAAVAAVSVLPERPPLVIVLLAAGAQSLAAAVVSRSTIAAYATPVLLTGAWLAFATESLTGSLEWFTIPVAAALLAMLDVYRSSRRREGGSLPVEAVYAEYVAMSLMVLPAVVESITVGLGYVALVMALAVVLVVWAIAAKVRRRVYGGVVSALVGALLVIFVPLARLVPQFRGPALWMVLGVIGLGLIAIATMIERGRRGVASAVTSLERLMGGWE